jgi:hypothetical protein
MIHIHHQTMKKTGKRRITVELDEGEEIIAVRPNAFYKLGYPFEEVVPSHVLDGAQQVTWCCIGQEWVS